MFSRSSVLVISTEVTNEIFPLYTLYGFHFISSEIFIVAFTFFFKV